LILFYLQKLIVIIDDDRDDERTDSLKIQGRIETFDILIDEIEEKLQIGIKLR